jgi:tetratricopeptide (TPR) repeat protein
MATLQITDDPNDYDVGDLGEIEFHRWCIKGGIVANRAQYDRKGWDFIIELPASGPRFRHDEFTAKVQVKATKSGAANARIKLDNLARMVTDPAPWFVLYYEFDQFGNMLSAYMVHVDRAFVANVHRVVSAQNPAELHKHKIAVGWANEDRIEPLEAIEFLRRIREAIGTSIWDYLEQKATWNTSALTRRLNGSLEFAEIAALREMVKRYHMLAQQHPNAFEPHLAKSMHNLGARLGESGNHKAALAAIRGAVELRRELVQRNPNAFQRDLVASLNISIAQLSNLERYEEALAEAREAVELLRELARCAPDAFQPELAKSLKNLSGRLSKGDQCEEALAATREAVELYRELVQRSPGVFQRALARCLNNLGVRLINLGHHEEGLAATREAVELHREVAQRNPHTFYPDLATSYKYLGVTFSKLGRHQEALAATRKGEQFWSRAV